MPVIPIAISGKALLPFPLYRGGHWSGERPGTCTGSFGYRKQHCRGLAAVCASQTMGRQAQHIYSFSRPSFRGTDSAFKLASSSSTVLWPLFPSFSADSGPQEAYFLSWSVWELPAEMQTQQRGACKRSQNRRQRQPCRGACAHLYTDTHGKYLTGTEMERGRIKERTEEQKQRGWGWRALSYMK